MQRLRSMCGGGSDSVGLYGNFLSNTFFCEVAKSPCVWWQKRVVLETMRQMETECCPLWVGMCPLTQVTMLNSGWAPGGKTCHSEIPGDALCEPFIISLSHVCLLAYSRLSDARTRGCGRGPSVRFESNESHPLIVICRVVQFMVITFNHSYYCQRCSVMTHFVIKKR